MIRSVKALFILSVLFMNQECFTASALSKKSASHQKNIIFDFDGTLADSMDNFLAAFNTLAPRYGLSLIKPQDREIVRSMSGYDLAKRQGIWLYQIPFFISDLKPALKAQTAERIADLKAHAGVVELIKSLSKRGYHLFIISSSELAAINSFLRKHAIESFFKDISAASYSDSPYKVTKLQNFMAKHSLDASTTLYVGDEQRDVEAALAAPLPIVAVSWGFNSKSFLTTARPTYIVDTASELNSIIEKHFAKK